MSPKELADLGEGWYRLQMTEEKKCRRCSEGSTVSISPMTWWRMLVPERGLEMAGIYAGVGKRERSVGNV